MPDGSFEMFSDEEMKKGGNDHQKESSFAEIHPSKSPAWIPPHELELEIINAWELMDGLEDTTPLGLSFASNTFHESGRNSPEPPPEKTKSQSISPTASQIWMRSTAEDDVEFDLDVISKFRMAMKELSPEETSLKHHETPNFPGIVKARVSAFQEKIDAKKASFKAAAGAGAGAAKASPLEKCPPGGRGKLVLYFTSLRVVRKTFEDCWNAKVIIQGYGFHIEERDVSMHGRFKDELREILGTEFAGSELPRVFANGKFLGGAEEVVRMHEAGELVKALRDCDVVPTEKERGSDACEGCGDLRFVMCENCSGSCRVFAGEVEEESGGGFRRCPDCNENGLVQCHFCCR